MWRQPTKLPKKKNALSGKTKPQLLCMPVPDITQEFTQIKQERLSIKLLSPKYATAYHKPAPGETSSNAICYAERAGTNEYQAIRLPKCTTVVSGNKAAATLHTKSMSLKNRTLCLTQNEQGRMSIKQFYHQKTPAAPHIQRLSLKTHNAMFDSEHSRTNEHQAILPPTSTPVSSSNKSSSYTACQVHAPEKAERYVSHRSSRNQVKHFRSQNT